MGGNFREKLEEASRIKVFGAIGSQMMQVNFELGACGANFGFDEKRWMSLV